MLIKVKKYKDTFTLAGRCCRLSKRNPDTFLTSIILPALMMLLFVFLFGNLIRVEGVSYVNYIVPAILLQCIAQGSSTTAIMINKDVSKGIVSRFAALPIKKSAVLNGYMVEAFLRNMISVLVVLGIAALLGFRPSLELKSIGIVGVLLVGTIGVFSWLAMVIGILAKSVEGASSLSAFAIILPYISSGFVPTETLPRILRGFAKYQPMTPIIDTMRNAMLGNASDLKIFAVALVWCIGLGVIFYGIAYSSFRKRFGA